MTLFWGMVTHTNNSGCLPSALGLVLTWENKRRESLIAKHMVTGIVATAIMGFEPLLKNAG